MPDIIVISLQEIFELVGENWTKILFNDGKKETSKWSQQLFAALNCF